MNNGELVTFLYVSQLIITFVAYMAAPPLYSADRLARYQLVLSGCIFVLAVMLMPFKSIPGFDMLLVAFFVMSLFWFVLMFQYLRDLVAVIGGTK